MTFRFAPPSVSSLTSLACTALLLGGPLRAQAPTALQAATGVATDAINARLSLGQLRRLRCVDPGFANCDGGLQVIQDAAIISATMRGDTVSFVVRWQFLGLVASSEASLNFLPDRDIGADSGTVTVIRRGARWMLDPRLVMSENPQTSVAAARAFFKFEADDRRALDSVAKVRRKSPASPPNER